VDVQPKTRGHKLKSGVDWQGALKQKSVKQVGRKKGLRLIPPKFLHEYMINALLSRKFTILH
jgi:hypothetical protein